MARLTGKTPWNDSTDVDPEYDLAYLMTLPPNKGTDWHQDAECRRLVAEGKERPDIWFAPGRSPEYHRALDHCYDCPVRRQCLEWASDTHQTHGIYGGQSPHQLRKNNYDFALIDLLPRPKVPVYLRDLYPSQGR